MALIIYGQHGIIKVGIRFGSGWYNALKLNDCMNNYMTTHDMQQAAERGNPSFVWREGQERRLTMVRDAVSLDAKHILDVGCGLGMYTNAFQRYSEHVFGIEIELDRAIQARARTRGVAQSVGESLPFEDNSFDVAFSHEVLEHVVDDACCAREMVRVVRPGGHIAIFVPNRLYFFETHGIYWKGEYKFGNKPLVNWLPNVLRNKLAPHVRAYTVQGLRTLFAGLPVKVVTHTQIFPGYDNIVHRRPAIGKVLQTVTYTMERTPLRMFGLSHFLVLQVLA